MNLNFSTFAPTRRPVVCTVKIPILNYKQLQMEPFHVLNFYVDPTELQVLQAISNLGSRAHNGQLLSFSPYQSHVLYQSCRKAVQDWKHHGVKLPINAQELKEHKIIIPMSRGPQVGLPAEMLLVIVSDKEFNDSFILAQLEQIANDIKAGDSGALNISPVQKDVVIGAVLDEIVRRKMAKFDSLFVPGNKVSKTVQNSQFVERINPPLYSEKEVREFVVNAWISGNEFANNPVLNARQKATDYFNAHRKI